MLKGLRCENEERVWETAYATAYVTLMFRYGSYQRKDVASASAAYVAQDIADGAVLQLRNLKEAVG